MPSETLELTAASLDAPVGPRDVASAATNIDSGSESPSLVQRLVDTISGASILRNGALSLVDQAVVSAVNFGTLVLIRHCGQDPASIQAAQHNTGLYQLAFSVITLVNLHSNRANFWAVRRVRAADGK